MDCQAGLESKIWLYAVYKKKHFKYKDIDRLKVKDRKQYNMQILIKIKLEWLYQQWPKYTSEKQILAGIKGNISSRNQFIKII